MGYIKTLNTGYTIGDLKEFSQYISQFLFFFFANIFQKVGVFQKVINWGNWLSYILDRFYFFTDRFGFFKIFVFSQSVHFFFQTSFNFFDFVRTGITKTYLAI